MGIPECLATSVPLSSEISPSKPQQIVSSCDQYHLGTHKMSGEARLEHAHMIDSLCAWRELQRQTLEASMHGLLTRCRLGGTQ